MSVTPIGPVSIDQLIEHFTPLPDAADLVVIGGGIAGVTCAWFAARAGKRVVLLEKGRIAGEQSSRNWGWIRTQGRDPAELPMAIEAQHLWRELAAETSEDIGLRPNGTAYLARNEADEARFAGWLPHAEAHGLDTRMLGASELGRMMPGARECDWRAALWTESDMCAEPWLAVPALARAAARNGVAIRENCAVRRLDREAGQVTGVVTEAGRIRCDRVVLAGGAWSSLFLRAHGIVIPQLSVRATVTRTTPLPDVFAGQAVDDHLAFRRRADGGYSLAASARHDFLIGPDALRHMSKFWPVVKKDILSTGLRPSSPRGYPDSWATRRNWSADEESPFERMRILNPHPNRRHSIDASRRFSAAFPGLGNVEVASAWAGMIDTMPDVVPVIDEVPDLPGLIVLTGLSGHGFGIGPGVGRVAADLAMGRDPRTDLNRFRISRFWDGSAIAPGPSL
ncbi:FAD-binding oxidoreductase [Palleronia sp. LCG004]|uniref:NAD(P)/FAD-dependent oxidoreductase n=1 Tax=Palleronia sp. LCG004 TaxID=3079304 RepID=UPI0029427745|nr:FAD-binding oxidoreductase [Palleronia sp. LCG004]WOI57263.1 FAD-binding oxidoreductase [Palleronia sp. LCG004]